MSQLANQWIDLFRAGNHGEKGNFTEQDVQQIVDNYRPEFHEAPAVIGHPQTDAPAYGWFDKLRRVGDLLQGMLKPDVDPTFEELVKAGRFKKRSVALYKGENGLSLRHVGFLGAQPPEIKGLANIAFDQQDKQAVEIEFSEEKDMPETPEQQQQRTFMESLSEFWEKRFGKSPTAATFSEADVKRISAEAAAVAVAPIQAQLDAQKQTFSETQTSQQKLEATRRADAAILKVKERRAWVPAFDKLGVPQLFHEAAKATATIEFGEGANKATKTQLEILTEFMEQLPAIVPNAPVYTGQSTAPTDVAKALGVTDSPRAPADPNSIKLDAAIRARMGDKGLDYGTAMRQITAEQPDLTRPGGAAAGAV